MTDSQADVEQKRMENTKAGEEVARLAMHSAKVASTASVTEATTAVSLRVPSVVVEADLEAQEAFHYFNNLGGSTEASLQ